ncbi:hypothetical protein Phi17218_159 [Cellulophaga phage phi17:2_18]|uniref:Uncharacterized protein n=2 Tax=Lightbulbvirus Cba172 TaxID=1918525 RepID=R9ZZI8_9CAUD|nr:hypothetical protein Phi17:2_gp159 [Cellulophaga phage phi17:2]AGO47692.1 hypothetical protein Phi17:2_gp159 [Cellulophaga phage phi17:2]ALO80562.1 hypothetical protein Phi17218_159 [Cellulophaga phage phi17:2_18]
MKIKKYNLKHYSKSKDEMHLTPFWPVVVIIGSFIIGILIAILCFT